MSTSRRAEPRRSQSPAPASARWRRPAWKDPRLSGGIALVGAAVALGGWAVAAAADTTDVYVLSQDVAPGTDLTADGVLTLVASHPGTGAYVEAGSLPQGAVATRSMTAGELLPRSAIGSAQDLGLRAVVLDVAATLPSTTGTGDYVDLWLLPDDGVRGDEAQSGAVMVAQGLVIAKVGEASTGLLGGPSTGVEVRVPQDSLDEVLGAVAKDGALVLVPTGQEAP